MAAGPRAGRPDQGVVDRVPVGKSADLALPNEPRPQYDPSLPLLKRYAAKAAELGIATHLAAPGESYRECGEAGLASPGRRAAACRSAVDRGRRADHGRAHLRVETLAGCRHFSDGEAAGAAVGSGAVQEPSRATAYRECRSNLSAHRYLAARPNATGTSPSGRSGATASCARADPGSTSSSTQRRWTCFALDPQTLQWVRVKLTVAMDWYTRCVVALRLTPFSTKAVDAAAVMYQIVRPEAGVRQLARRMRYGPNTACRAKSSSTRPVRPHRQGSRVAGLNPESIVIDHGKIYVSEHLTSVCQRLGISIQPARSGTGGTKDPSKDSSAPFAKDCCSTCPATRAQTSTPAASTPKTRRSSTSINSKPLCGNG